MKVDIDVNTERPEDEVIKIIAHSLYAGYGSEIVPHEEIVPRGKLEKMIGQAVNDLVEAHKDEIIENATERASREIQRKGMQKYLDFLKKEYSK